jgi:hypothetical protein
LYDGDWEQYLAAIYAVFRRDFVLSRPNFAGRRLGLKRLPLEGGKEATFWHFISEGKDEETRLPDLRRCERIAWIRPMIEAVGTVKVLAWPAARKNEKRIQVCLLDFSYMVVLADRGDYLLPWTAFMIDHEYRRQALKREYEAYMASQKS